MATSARDQCRTNEHTVVPVQHSRHWELPMRRRILEEQIYEILEATGVEPGRQRSGSVSY